MTITTNNQPRDLRGFWDFSEADQSTIREEFDWMEDLEGDCSFFKYKGNIYNLADFMHSGSPEGWDGNAPNSYFSGVLVKLSSDCEKVTCGWWSV